LRYFRRFRPEFGRLREIFCDFCDFCIYIGNRLCNVFLRNMKLLSAHSPELPPQKALRLRAFAGSSRDTKKGLFANFCPCVMALLALPRQMNAGSDQSRAFPIDRFIRPLMAGLPEMGKSILPP
jgi:hypothetical protein